MCRSREREIGGGKGRNRGRGMGRAKYSGTVVEIKARRGVVSVARVVEGEVAYARWGLGQE